jgi:hypothetical protein
MLCLFDSCIIINVPINKTTPENMVKIQELKHGGQLIITIPRAIAQAKGFKKGMELEFIIDNMGQLIIRPKQV